MTAHLDLLTSVPAFQIFWVFNMVQDFSFGLAKLSVLFFYRRIFSTPVFKGLTTTLMAIVSIWSVGFFFAYLFRCGTNFWALWAPLEDLIKYCYTSTPMFYALGISDVVTDVLILILPFFWVRAFILPRSPFTSEYVLLMSKIDLETEHDSRQEAGRLRCLPPRRYVRLPAAIPTITRLTRDPWFSEIATGIVRLVIYIKQATSTSTLVEGGGTVSNPMLTTMDLKTPTRTQTESAI